MNTLTPIINKDALVTAAQRLGDTWSLLIVSELLSGSRRFGELQEALKTVSPQTLSGRLKMLETYGFITRQAYAEIPPRVEYQLTEKGLALADIVQALSTFGEKYMLVPADVTCEPTITTDKG